MINVLIVANNMNPVDGGISTFVMNTLKYTDKNKIHLDFVIHYPQLESVKKTVEEYGSKMYQVSPYNPIKYRKFWKNFFKCHHEYDIIHIHSFDPTILYLGLARHNHLTTIVHSHVTNMPKFNLVDRICRLNQYGSRLKAQFFLGCSRRAIADRFGKKIANSSKCEVIPNGINTELFRYNPIARDNIRKALSLAPSQTVIGHVGRFEYSKNQVFIIKVFYEFLKYRPNSTLVLIGEGEDRIKIENEITQLKIENNVILTGKQTNIFEYLSAFDLFIFPSTYEGLGIALVEAQCSGLPCFVSKDVIVPECDMGCNLLNRISLNTSPSEWAKEMAKHSISNNRNQYADKVRTHGYDIKESVKFLEDFYIEHAPKNQ